MHFPSTFYLICPHRTLVNLWFTTKTFRVALEDDILLSLLVGQAVHAMHTDDANYPLLVNHNGNFFTTITAIATYYLSDLSHIFVPPCQLFLRVAAYGVLAMLDIMFIGYPKLCAGALYNAGRYGHVNIINYIYNMTDDRPDDAFNGALAGDQLPTIAYMVSRHFYPDDRRTVSSWAECSALSIIIYLRDHHLLDIAVSLEGAAYWGRDDVITCLCPTTPTREQREHLFRGAATAGNTLLMDRYHDVDSSVLRTALLRAVDNQCRDTITWFFTHGKVEDIRAVARKAARVSADMLQFIITLHPDPPMNKEGALIDACRSGDLATIKLLLKLGATNIEAAIILSIREARVNVVAYLLNKCDIISPAIINNIRNSRCAPLAKLVVDIRARNVRGRGGM